MSMAVVRPSLSRWDVHFARLGDEDLMKAVDERFNDHIARLKSTNQFQRMDRAYHEFYAEGLNGEDKTLIMQQGKQGERTVIHVAHFRQLVDTMVNLAHGEPPNFDAEATSNDSESLIEAGLANGIIDWYLDDHLLDDFRRTTVMGLIFGESWVDSVWDRHKGPDSRVVDTAQGPKVQKAGDTDTYVYGPLDCAVDPFARKRNDPDWAVLHRWVNRWRLIAEYPHLEDMLKAVPAGPEDETSFDNGLYLNNDEYLCLSLFFHRDCQEVPGGKYAYFVGGGQGVFLEGGPNPYGSELPVDRFAVSDVLRGASGWTPAFDMLSICEAIGAQYSHILSNHTAFGTQVMLAEKGHGLNYEDLTTGLALIEHEPGKAPVPANFVQSPPEMFAFLSALEKVLETISGVPSMLRGNNDSNLKSGSALAMVHSTGMQIQSGVQEAVMRMERGVLTKRIANLKRFATDERTVDIVGKDRANSVKTYSKDSLGRVRRVVVRKKNPMFDTDMGRMELIKTLAQIPGIQLNMSEIVTFVQTGRMQLMWQATDKQNQAIHQENEQLRDMNAPLPHVMPWEPHDRHIAEHAADIADPARRNDEGLFARYSEHIQKHVEAKTSVHPAVLALSGTQPIAPNKEPQMGKGDGAPPEAEKPGKSPPGRQEGMTGKPASLPKMPQNPETGRREAPNPGTPARQ